MGLSNIRNLKHKYESTRTQLLKKIDGAQSSIEKRLIPPKDINNQAWHLAKGPWKTFTIFDSHTYITFLSKFIKKDRKEEGDTIHMK